MKEYDWCPTNKEKEDLGIIELFSALKENYSFHTYYRKDQKFFIERGKDGFDVRGNNNDINGYKRNFSTFYDAVMSMTNLYPFLFHWLLPIFLFIGVESFLYPLS